MQFLIKIIITCLIYSTVYAGTLSQSIHALINEKLPHAQVGLVITDADTGSIIYQKQGTQLFYPASSIKLFLATAVYYRLGENYQFHTDLSAYQKNIYFTFSGAPDFTSADLGMMVKQLKLNRIHTVDGNIILDSSRFSKPDYLDGTSYDDLGWYYAAPSNAIVLNENAEKYRFISAKRLGGAVRIIPENQTHILNIQNHLRTVTKGESKNRCALHVGIRIDNTVKLYGCYARLKQPKIMNLSIPNPSLFAQQTILAALKQNHINFKGRLLEGKTPHQAKKLYRQPSLPMSELLSRMLLESDNLYATNLTKLLGYVESHQGSTKQGVYTMKKILKARTHLDMDQIEIEDGVGTRYNMSTPGQIVTLLNDIYHDKNAKRFFMKSLPRMAKSGSLSGRMNNTKLVDQVIAKTGTMHDISSLSGYLLLPSGKTLIFSMISNGVNIPISNAKALEDAILLKVFEQYT